MKLIKKFVSKLLGGKSPVKSAAKKSPSAKGPHTKSESSKTRSESSAKADLTSSGSSRKGRRGSGNRQQTPAGQDRRRRRDEGGGAEQQRTPEGGQERRRRRDENGGAEQQRTPEGGQDRRKHTPGEGEGSGTDQPQRRRSTQRRKPGSEDTSGRVHARTGGIARPRAQDGRGPRGRDSSGVRPGGAITAEASTKLLAAHAEWDSASFTVEPAEGKKRFQDFDLPSELMHAVADLGFEYCTPIQAVSLEHALAGKNVAGKAQTGTGKTAAFLIAILTRYLRSPEKRMEKPGVPRALVIAPTRELVIQICKDAADLGKYCGLRTLAVYGGMDYDRQKKEVLAEPIDLLVATPGRLLDYSRQRIIDLSQVDTLVIDEADRMLDMGFIPDVRVIMNRLPPKDKRGTMLYSATLSDDVMRLASQWMDAPVNVEIESENMTTDTVDQVVYVVTASEKFTVLYNLLQQYPDTRILVFCNRKVTTEGIVRKLQRLNVSCDMLSGDVNQNRRLRVLEDFRDGKVRVVIATDVAGRGIHVDDVGFVVNYDFPYEAEDYVHRIGRTGRAGQEGTAISFADEDESFIIPEIEAFIKQPLKCTMLMGDHPLMADIPKQGRAHPPRVHKERHVENSTDKAGSDVQPAEVEAVAEVKAETETVQMPEAQTSDAPKSDDDSSLSVETKAPDIEKVPDIEKTAENKKETERKNFRGRGDSRSAASASPRRPRSSAGRSRDRDVIMDNTQTVPLNMTAKGPRFSDEWVPGQ